MKGVDISNLNGDVDMRLVASEGNSFIVAKASEGGTFVDSYYTQNIANARAAGMLAGAYHFARFRTVEKAVQEANFFASVCRDAAPDFVVLDFEQQCSGDMTEACLAFLAIISEIAPALIYCNPSYIDEYLNADITKYPLWIAHYTNGSPRTPLWGGYAIWQYSEHGRISGVEGDIDLNIMDDDFYNSLKNKGDDKVENVVVYNNDVDKRAAEYLADFLQCPTIPGRNSFDYSKVKNVYGVGGGDFSGKASQVIKGNDRYDTIIAVLKFMKKL